GAREDPPDAQGVVRVGGEGDRRHPGLRARDAGRLLRDEALQAGDTARADVALARAPGPAHRLRAREQHRAAVDGPRAGGAEEEGRGEEGRGEGSEIREVI